MNRQLCDLILMIRPKAFGYNPQTAADNAFQNISDRNVDEKLIAQQAILEFDRIVEKLKSHNVDLLIVEDSDIPPKPDAIFPNNWFSTHSNGILVSYSLMSKSRRPERRDDIMAILDSQYGFNRRYAFEYLEDENIFLEGTGSMVLDRVNKIVFATLSERTHIEAVEKFAILMGYTKHIFHATDESGKAIYHTNVMMSIASDYVLICLETIGDPTERKEVLASLSNRGRTIVTVSLAQMHKFACNSIQVKNKYGDALTIISEEAVNSLNPDQIDAIRQSGEIISVSLPTIEKYGGGGIRCMIAEIFKD